METNIFLKETRSTIHWFTTILFYNWHWARLKLGVTVQILRG